VPRSVCSGGLCVLFELCWTREKNFRPQLAERWGCCLRRVGAAGGEVRGGTVMCGAGRGERIRDCCGGHFCCANRGSRRTDEPGSCSSAEETRRKVRRREHAQDRPALRPRTRTAHSLLQSGPIARRQTTRRQVEKFFRIEPEPGPRRGRLRRAIEARDAAARSSRPVARSPVLARGARPS